MKNRLGIVIDDERKPSAWDMSTKDDKRFAGLLSSGFVVMSRGLINGLRAETASNWTTGDVRVWLTRVAWLK